MLTIDLEALQANYRRLAQAAAPARCAAVVKADAYGLGLDRVAPALAEAGANTFFVALPEEGMRLRSLLPDVTIYVLSGFFEGAETDYAEYQLRPVLNSLPDIERYRRLTIETALPAALHLDTGMSRLGLSRAEWHRLQEDPELVQGLDLRLFMSHLACAEDREAPLNTTQQERFRQARAFLPDIPASLANSSGIFLGPDYGFELVRPGVALYGANPTPGLESPMRPVVRLSVRILQVREIDSGESVGYGATYTADAPRRVATIAAGYADGVHRALSSTGRAWIGGYELPFLGRVSMDLISLDVSNLPEALAQQGQSVDLLGPDQDIDSLAGQAGTIAYEMLTSLGRRYHRQYLDHTT
ncbi:alanine racemase [Fodinicurvata halophila]|uniref:Alanine racemase n=1 Tax=Fodinicurvata halophila TaxID=1419723 RepID=A0ABV8UKS1_9PROT